MDYFEWRNTVYTPLLLCANELTKNTALSYLVGGSVNHNVDSCMKKYGEHCIEMCLAHSITRRIGNSEGLPEDIISWARTIEPIKQPEGCYSNKRTFWELMMRCDNKVLVAITKRFWEVTAETEERGELCAV